MDFRSWLQTLQETETYELIRDLLVAMQYDRIAITHGVQEFGRDLVFRERDSIGREIWRGIQVKTEAPTGSFTSAKGLRSLIYQCEGALDAPYLTTDGKSLKLTEVWLVLTQPLKEGAKQSAQGRLRDHGIYLIDGSHLADIITEHLPELVRRRSGPLDAYLLHLIESSDLVNPYISVKLGSKLRLSEIYIPPLCGLELATEQTIAYITQERLDLDIEFLAGNASMISLLGRTDILPAGYHYRATEAISRLQELTDLSLRLDWFQDSDRDAAKRVSSLGSGLGLGNSTYQSGDGLSEGPDYRGELGRRQLKTSLERLDFNKIAGLEPFRRVQRVRRRLSKAKNNYNEGKAGKGKVVDLTIAKKRIRQAEEDLGNAQKDLKRFMERVLNTYNDVRDWSHPLMPVVEELAREVFQHKSLEAPWETRAAWQTKVADGIRRLREYTGSLSRALAERIRLLDARARQELGRVESNYEASWEDLGLLGELRFLTVLVCRYYDLPSEAIDLTRLDAHSLCKLTKLGVVEGELGIGKTTLLRRVAGDLATELRAGTNKDLPLFVALGNVSPDQTADLTSRFLEAVEGNLPSVIPERIAWFLDGFDEVQNAELRKDIVAWLAAIREPARAVVSARPFSLREHLPNALKIELLRLDDIQVEDFIRKFPWPETADSQRMTRVLSKDRRLKELARSPLLLTLICLIAKSQGPENLPTRREAIYSLIVDLLLSEWDLSKGLRRQQIVEDESLRLVLLSRVAYRLYAEGKRYFSQEEFVDLIVAEYPKGDLAMDMSRRFFMDLVRDCILVPFARKTFGFLHFSLQEYLSAIDVSRDVDLKRVYGAVEELINQDGRWEEVLVFYASLKRDIRPVLESLHREKLSFFMNDGRVNQDLVRLLERMLAVADFTSLEGIKVRGVVAAAFAQMEVGGNPAFWLEQRWLPG